MTNSMNDESTDIDLIERYHRGLLDAPELADFLRREKADKDFADKVRSYVHIIEGIEYYGKQKDFADTLQEWEEEIKGTAKKKRAGLTLTQGETEKNVVPINRRSVFWLAAAAISLLIVSSIFLLRSVNPGPEVLYEAYYQPYPNVFDPAVRGGEKDSISLLGKAFRQYDEGNYARAAEYFKEGLITDSKIEKDIALLYLGNCYLAQNSADAARETLVQIDEQSHVADQGKWYLALAYLKLNNPDLAKKTLSKLSDHQNSYQDKAKALLHEIR